MNPMKAARRGPSPRVAGLCLVAAALVLVPNIALAADSSGSTIRAAIGSDGSVSSVRLYNPDGTSSAFTDELPIAMTISNTTSGTTRTYTYHVENKDSKTETVHYDDTSGNPLHTSVTLQLPLVAQLGVDVPKSLKDVSAAGATITTSSDGTRHLLWNMVLFTPLGSPAQDVTFTATGDGDPVAEVRAAAVDPNSTAGLSAAGQAATAGYQQDDFWAGYAGGGNDGLKQLSDGTSQMIDGLVQLFAGTTQLHNGIVLGANGAVLLDDGTRKAYVGAQKLSHGLGRIHGGLGQLANKTKGLPAALSGVKQLKAGMNKILAGVGNDTANGTLINGVDQIASGLDVLVVGITNPGNGVTTGVSCASDVLDVVVNGNTTAKADPCWAAAPFNGTKPVLPALGTVPGTDTYAAILNGVLTQAVAPSAAGLQNIGAAMKQLAAGVAALRTGLSHKAGAAGHSDPGGLKEGLAQVRGGLAQLRGGLAKAVGGVGKLHVGTGKAFKGSKDLAGGLKQLSDGQHQVATGLPAAVSGTSQLSDGVGQVLDGAKQVHDGIDQVRSGATGPLGKQLVQASQNNHKQLAVLQAAAAMANDAPGGAGTSYVFSQTDSGLTLAAGVTTGSAVGHTGRNLGIGLGGVVLLLAGVGGGFALGRRRTAA